jgi:hypothetical protein
MLLRLEIQLVHYVPCPKEQDVHMCITTLKLPGISETAPAPMGVAVGRNWIQRRNLRMGSDQPSAFGRAVVRIPRILTF